MSQTTIEQRLNRLEKIVAGVVKQLSQHEPRRKDWRKTVGKFDGDKVMGEIIEGALKSREMERSQFYAEYEKDQKAS